MSVRSSTLFGAMLLAGTAWGAGLVPAPLAAQVTAPAPTTLVQVGIGRGRLVTLAAPMSDLFVANPEIADVQVRSPTQLWVFGKGAGETTVYATTKAGRVVYSANIRVGANYDTLQGMLSLAMPEAHITATTMNGAVLLTGTVANPGDVADAEELVQAFVGKDVKILTRLKTATPLQVNLRVRIAEVSRNFMKNVGVNLASMDSTGGFKFGVGQGRSFYPQYTPGGPLGVGTEATTGVTAVTGLAGGTSLFGAGKLLGLDILSAIDLGETVGQVSTLASPNLTALSGETASFLAGGEIPIPVSQGLGAVSVEYKQYGVSLAYTPTVLSDGRISLRVRPEVSQLSAAGSVQIEGTTIPALTTRRAETTVELGSGQSFVIAGLLQNSHDNSITKAPGLGDLPVLGALFRSNSFRRDETELVIVVTPYLVKPVNAADVVLPTDGYKAPTDAERILLGQLQGNNAAEARPRPSVAPSGAAPQLGAVSPVPTNPAFPTAAASEKADKRSKKQKKKGDAAPGFSFP